VCTPQQRHLQTTRLPPRARLLEVTPTFCLLHAAGDFTNIARVQPKIHLFYSPTSPPLRSPPSRLGSGSAAFLSPSASRFATSPSTHDASSTSAVKNAAHSSDSIPVFYVKQTINNDVLASVTSQSMLRQAFAALSPPNISNFISMARDTLNLSSGCAFLLFNKICSKFDSNDEDLADSEKLLSFWQAHKLCTPNQLFFQLLVRNGRSSVTSSDFAELVRYVALSHPGLDFLKATPEFQDRYCDCVIEQIIYFNTSDLSQALSQRDIANSDIAEAFMALDDEDDINKFTKYFSYQHFYVLYCKVSF
jgi:serine/threonine-protein phosphatase 2A regulatory subunit B''